MARRMTSEEQTAARYPEEDELPTRIAAPPLILDDRLEADDEDESDEDMEDGDLRERLGAARTMFRQARTDHDTVNSVRSLYDSDVAYTMIHGRRYAGDWYLPNDEEEQQRQQMLHTIYNHVIGKLTTVPLHNPTRILDWGTGTGEWAIAMGEDYPEAEVLGIDIARIQDSRVPVNVFFEIDDAEEDGEWTWSGNEFDLVHFRYMAGAFMDWKRIYRETFRNLKPGGYVEVIDFDNHDSFLSYFDPDGPTARFMKALNAGMKKAGRPFGLEHLMPRLLRDAGFVNVSVSEKTIPMGAWPDDPEEKKIGKHFLVTRLWGAEAVCLRPLTEQLGWAIEDVTKLCDEVVDEIRTIGMDPVKGHGLNFKLRILTGKKPGGGLLEVDIPDGSSTMGDSIRTITQTNGGAH